MTVALMEEVKARELHGGYSAMTRNAKAALARSPRRRSRAPHHCAWRLLTCCTDWHWASPSKFSIFRRHRRFGLNKKGLVMFVPGLVAFQVYRAAKGGVAAEPVTLLLLEWAWCRW